MAKLEYSCKRKKDYITLFAIAMFLVICVFELFLIFVLPVRLKQQDAMEYHVKKQNMLTWTEDLRRKTRQAKPRSPVQECEVQLVMDSLDTITRSIRQNNHDMTISQVNDVCSMLDRFQVIVNGWSNGKYQVVERDFDITPILKTMEKKLDRASRSR